MVIKENFVIINGISTRYWQAGNTGSTIVCLHGLGASLEHWQYNIKDLASKHKVYLVDLLGFGRTYPPKENFFATTFVEFIANFINTLKLNNLTLVGHSFGGGIALMLVIEKQLGIRELDVRRLVLVNSAGLGNKVAFWLRFFSLPMLEKLLPNIKKQQVQTIFNMLLYNHAVLTEDFINTIYTLSCTPKYRTSLFTTLRQHINIFGVKYNLLKPILDNLSRISMPTLIIWGKQDNILPVSHAYYAHSQIKNSECFIFEQCKHMPQLEYPKKFNQLVLEFISKYGESSV